MVRLAVLFFLLSMPVEQEPVALRQPSHAGATEPVTLSRVTLPTPFASACNGAQTGTNYRNAPVEPFVTVDPANPAHLIGVWQQDRWSNGGASGLLTAVSMDRGRTWTSTYAHFSACSGGIYDRASDPWVAISPDGTAYQVALGLKDNNATTSVLVSRSTDGGLTWGDPVTLILDPSTSPQGDDKESITADPNDAHYVYSVWDRVQGNSSTTYRAPAFFSRTTDGGATWESSRALYDPGLNAGTIGNQIVVLPDGTLVDLFTLFRPAFGAGSTTYEAVVRSTDHGVTWSSPVMIATNQSIGTVDARTQRPVRTGSGLASIAVDPGSGAIYVVWADARFSGFQRDGIALARSTDGGVTWSAPVQVNQAPNVQAFTPAVAVNAAGTVVVTYYDFRKATAAPGPLLTNYWRITSVNGGQSWRETPVAGPFNIQSAPLDSTRGPFLGDYQGVVATGASFLTFFVVANSGNPENPTDVFATTEERSGDTTSNRITEVNLRPQRVEIPTRRVPRPLR